jgi:6-phosphofructokinase 1
MGLKAVELALDGKTNLMVSIKDNRIGTTDLEKAVKGHHEVNAELIRVSDIMSI